MTQMIVINGTTYNEYEVAELIDIKNRFERFKKEVVETTVNWDGGCESGKREFLEALDLEVPSTRVEFTAIVNIEMGTDIDDLETEVRDAIYYNCDGLTDVESVTNKVLKDGE